MRHWMRHILDVVLLTSILASKSSSVHLLKNILSSSLQNLSLSIVSDDCVLYALIYHYVVDFINESHHDINNIVFKTSVRSACDAHEMAQISQSPNIN